MEINVLPAIVIFYSALSSMHCSEAERATETCLECICVHIHPTLDSSRSGDSQLGPAGEMTSEHFSSQSHKPCLHETETKSIRDDLISVIVYIYNRCLHETRMKNAQTKPN